MQICILQLHGMRLCMWHAPPARKVFCARRVDRHVFSAEIYSADRAPLYLKTNRINLNCMHMNGSAATAMPKCAEISSCSRGVEKADGSQNKLPTVLSMPIKASMPSHTCKISANRPPGPRPSRRRVCLQSYRTPSPTRLGAFDPASPQGRGTSH